MQEHGERSGQDFWRDFFPSPGNLDGKPISPGSLPFIQPITQALSPQPSVCPFDKSFGPILTVEGLFLLCLITAKPLHASLGILSSPAFILTGLSLSSSPSFPSPLPSSPWLGISFVKALRCSFCSSAGET